MDTVKKIKLTAWVVLGIAVAGLAQSAYSIQSRHRHLPAMVVLDLALQIILFIYATAWLMMLARGSRRAILLTSIMLLLPLTMIVSHIVVVWFTEKDIALVGVLTIGLAAFAFLYVRFVWSWWLRRRKDLFI